ncbi:MAG: allantoicase, partial [Actinomycetota bacterium]
MDLASSRYGGAVLWCSDEFFAAASNLVNPAPPVWREGEFTQHGKWMDGWETRRRRDEGYDSCVIRMGLPGRIRSVTVDTSHFTGNQPESFSLDATGREGGLEEAQWAEVVPRTPLSPDTTATFEVSDPHRATYVRLNIYPDGGVARLRVEGDPIPSPDQICPAGELVDLAVATLGGECVGASDAHFSSPANLVSPGEPEGMWDGWETARRRGPGHDWAVIDLGLTGTVRAVDVDTRFFKGNAPGWVHLEVSAADGQWRACCEQTKVSADSVNRIELDETEAERLRLNIHPDGGVARVRVWGRPSPASASRAALRYLNSLFPPQ